jgi:aminoglycoside phosphotransferase (APT) family kinase protein
VLESIKQYGGYYDFAFAMSQIHTESLQARALPSATQARFQSSVAESLAALQRADAAARLPFVDFVAAYFA